MRRTYRKGNYDELNKKILIMGFVFIVFIILGTYLNKVWSNSQRNIFDSINSVVNYYGSNVKMKDVVMSNLKSDIGFMGLICILSLFIITFPIAIIIFMLKGLSIGYTINSCILTLKFKSIKMILIVLFKNFIIIPGTIILALISLNYIKEGIYELKKRDIDSILFLSRRYLLNSVIVLTISVGLQVILNTASVSILQFLVR
ncbi:hypothetical protein CHF27_001120 [Romboutsia maritimum]|uniref:Stage II sporulation protein M n=1 Tax=Romboutsia maritimum TaxID=2020948 RepID=A0A371IWI6_9FIRM|nr:stage II sporulation protein M [Romboutsia maritimum]RDY24828.1 hypothetical protein CHF27_001120 [Romboutsia maritimum]